MSAKRKFKLLLSDVDGTLIDSGKNLPESARLAALALEKSGTRIAIASSRPPRGMKYIIDPLGIDTPVAAFNGGMFVTPRLEPIHIDALPPPLVRDVIRFLHAHNIDVWVYEGDRWLVQNTGNPHVAKETHAVRFACEGVIDYEGLRGPVAKIVGVSDEHESLARVEGEARARFGARISASRSQPYYLDVTSPRATKRHALRYLSEYLGIPGEAIATIGDGHNDVQMFESSGLAIAMGNAPPDVQERADVVVSSNDDGGFAEAVEKYLL